METYDNRDKLKMIKHYFIFNMLQQPSCFININKTNKKSQKKIKQENKYTNNSSTEKNENDNASTEFVQKVQKVIVEKDSVPRFPICDKLTMAKFLVILKLLQQTGHTKNINKASKEKSINNTNQNQATRNDLNLFKSSKNKNAKFMFFIHKTTFKNNSLFINEKGENDTSGDITEFNENDKSDYLDSLIPPPPIIIEEKDIDVDIPIE